MNKNKIFVTGIDTNIGKTVVSSLLVKALEADYWKPFQCGTEEETDSQFVQRVCQGEETNVHQESYSLELPQSPHYAAAQQGITINLNELKVPQVSKNLIVEGAGGMLVPINDHDFVIDLASKEKMSVILVTQHYLGSLNHTFLSVEALRQRGLRILGLVFNGKENLEYETFVSRRCDLPILFKVPAFPNLTREALSSYSEKVKERMELFL